MTAGADESLRRRMRVFGGSSLMMALTRSLLLGLTLMWLIGVVGSGFVLQRLIDGRSDEELFETGLVLLSFMRHTDDLLVLAAAMGDVQASTGAAHHSDRFAYQVLDATGTVLLRSQNAPAVEVAAPLREGFADVAGWRVATLVDTASGRFLQLADPLAERREALVDALLLLTAPLAILLAFAALMVFRASRSLMTHVQRTASAVTEQDPQALGMLPLTDVVTEMRPAVEATNRLLGRVAHALEAERSFTYNSAHEIRTPIAAALAQAQLLASVCGTPELKAQAGRLVDSLVRLSRLAERLLALARAEGAEPLDREWVDLEQVARLVVDEFRNDARLGGRALTAEGGPVRVRADLDAVGLAVRNLVENALTHGQGGRFIRLISGSADGEASLTVIDDGAGVDPLELPALTRRFVRGRGAEGSGAGLGLSIVNMLARRLGARLVLRSPPTGFRTGLEARLVWLQSDSRRQQR